MVDRLLGLSCESWQQKHGLFVQWTGNHQFLRSCRCFQWQAAGRTERSSPLAFRSAVFLLHFHFIHHLTLCSLHHYLPLCKVDSLRSFSLSAHLTHFVLLLLCPLLFSLTLDELVSCWLILDFPQISGQETIVFIGLEQYLQQRTAGRSLQILYAVWSQIWYCSVIFFY